VRERSGVPIQTVKKKGVMWQCPFSMEDSSILCRNFNNFNDIFCARALSRTMRSRLL
jgi:hypothetical protein